MPKKKFKNLKKKIVKNRPSRSEVMLRLDAVPKQGRPKQLMRPKDASITSKKIVKISLKKAAKDIKKVKVAFASPKIEHKIHLKKIDEHVKALREEHTPPIPPTSHLSLNPHFKHRALMFVSVAVVSIFAAVSIFAFLNNSQNQNLNQADAIGADTNVEEEVQNVPVVPAVADSGEAVSLLATGDVMFARYVELKMRRNNDYTWPFHNISDFLKSADITFGNLETPLLPGRNVQTNAMTFRADLKSTEALKFAGYDIVSIANNHTMNYQIPGLTSTLQELKKAEIKYVGGGKNLETAYAPVIIEAKGQKIAFLAYNDKSIPPKFHGEAGQNMPGIAPMDIEAMKGHVSAAKQVADFVVVSMHAGKEYVKEPSQFQKDFAHAAIDAGASAVLGTHPHIVQGIEYYGSGVIFYSLGNFVFDQFFSKDVQTGLAVKLNLVKGEVPGVELFPVFVDNTQPRLLEGDEREAVLKNLGLL